MNMQKISLHSKKSALVLALGLMASLGLNQTALAADLYAGALIGYGKAKIDSSDNDDFNPDLSDMTFSVFGGSQVWENNNGVGFGVEGFYTNFGEFLKNSYNNGTFKGSSTVDGSAFGIALIPNFKTGDVDVFGKFGIHRFSINSVHTDTELNGSDTENESSTYSDTSYVLGAGVKYKIHDNFSGVALAEYYNLDADDDLRSTVLSIGIQANF